MASVSALPSSTLDNADALVLLFVGSSIVEAVLQGLNGVGLGVVYCATHDYIPKTRRALIPEIQRLQSLRELAHRR